jgi:hypothetical protein
MRPFVLRRLLGLLLALLLAALLLLQSQVRVAQDAVSVSTPVPGGTCEKRFTPAFPFVSFGCQPTPQPVPPAAPPPGTP